MDRRQKLPALRATLDLPTKNMIEQSSGARGLQYPGGRGADYEFSITAFATGSRNHQAGLQISWATILLEFAHVTATV